MKRQCLLALVTALASCSTAWAQNNLEQMMNGLSPDAHLPSAAGNRPPMAAGLQLNQRQSGQMQAPMGFLYGQPQSQQMPYRQGQFAPMNGYPAGLGGGAQGGPWRMGSSGQRPQAAQAPNLLQMFMGGGQQQPKPPAQDVNPFSMKGMMQAFFGGNTSGSAGDSQALGTAQENLQTALDQAQQAEDAAGRASYGDRSSRLSAAEEAQNHANAARGAADRATSAAAGHQLSANDAASQARDAANRAQAAADQAQYNANSGQ